VIGGPKVMDVLLDVERMYEKVGLNMVGTFFPSGIRDNEQAKFDAIKEERKRKKENKLMESSSNGGEAGVNEKSAKDDAIVIAAIK